MDVKTRSELYEILNMTALPPETSVEELQYMFRTALMKGDPRTKTLFPPDCPEHNRLVASEDHMPWIKQIWMGALSCGGRAPTFEL